MDKYIDYLNRLRFEKLSEYSVYQEQNLPKNQNRLFVYSLKDKGIILRFETDESKRMSRVAFYYNWKSNGSLNPIQKGKFINDVWVGRHEGLLVLNNLIKLLDFGQFIVPWEYNQTIWLTHNQEEYNDFADDELQSERSENLPNWTKGVNHE